MRLICVKVTMRLVQVPSSQENWSTAHYPPQQPRTKGDIHLLGEDRGDLESRHGGGSKRFRAIHTLESQVNGRVPGGQVAHGRSALKGHFFVLESARGTWGGHAPAGNGSRE